VTRECPIVILAQLSSTALVQGISNCGEIQNTTLLLMKVLNVLMYGSLRFDEIQYVGEQTYKLAVTCKRWRTIDMLPCLINKDCQNSRQQYYSR